MSNEKRNAGVIRMIEPYEKPSMQIYEMELEDAILEGGADSGGDGGSYSSYDWRADKEPQNYNDYKY